MAQILNFLLEKDFSDTIIIINCSDSNEPYFFISELIHKGLVPKVLKQENRILLVECEEIGLRIINSVNYVQTSCSELKNRPKQRTYFPQKWNKKSCYDYVGKIPSYNDFLFFDDSPSLIESKIKYVSNFKETWNFKEKLVEHITEKVKGTAQVFLEFLSSTFHMQQRLFAEFGVNQDLLHPLKAPLLTFSGFAYNLFLTLSKSDLRMIKGPIEYNSSKGEVEFAQYLEHLFGRHLEQAWSPYGQSKHFLPISIPDVYDKETNTLYYYNGCYIHQHSKQNCQFRKRMQTSTPNCDSLFYEKMKRLSYHSDSRQIKIVWQCAWNKEKRENPSVKHFMRTIYRNPPLYRLDPRCSGKSVTYT